MKNLRMFFLLFAAMTMLQMASAQDKEGLYIEWTGEDEIANAFVKHGVHHWLNIEFAKARTYFEAAIAQDPTLFASHVALAGLTKGEMSEAHKAKAKELSKKKNEVSKLFVSTLDVEDGKAGKKQEHEIWAKMHKLSEGRLIHFGYAQTMEDPEEMIAELEKLAAILEKDKRNTGHIHNILGYAQYGQGNKEQAKKHFEKYLELYPDGYNPYDSMAEFYLNEGDHENALANYKMALNRFPASTNAINKIKEIEKKMNEQDGMLIVVDVEHVDPQYMDDYWKWGKEYKAIAEKTGYETFWVNASNGSYGYAAVAGKTLADLEAKDKEWKEWAKANPEIEEMYNKYKHSVTHRHREVWRSSPNLSYRPEGYSAPAKPEYVRTFKAYLKFGHGDSVQAILKDYKTTWAAAGVSQPYSVFWNEFGEEGPCVGIRSVYKDKATWAAEDKEVKEKVGKEKLTALRNRWVQHTRHFKNSESYPIEEMTHIKEVQVASGN